VGNSVDETVVAAVGEKVGSRVAGIGVGRSVIGATVGCAVNNEGFD
jgi:hypothetical protein